MKSSTLDTVEGKARQADGKIKQVVGKAVGNPDMEAEGRVEKISGKIQEKVGQIEKVVGK